MLKIVQILVFLTLAYGLAIQLNLTQTFIMALGPKHVLMTSAII